ncbi:MAG: hypothetical protein IJ892_09895 [Prevotella sp.]|nr:hypothetical protein [Prevotella sp.]
MQPILAQGQQASGLARLSGSMQHEVLALPYEQLHLIHIDALQRVDIVVDVGHDRACRTEEFLHGANIWDKDTQKSCNRKAILKD